MGIHRDPTDSVMVASEVSLRKECLDCWIIFMARGAACSQLFYGGIGWVLVSQAGGFRSKQSTLDHLSSSLVVVGSFMTAGPGQCVGGSQRLVGDRTLCWCAKRREMEQVSTDQDG